MVSHRFITAIALWGATAMPALAQNVDSAPEHATWVGGLLVIMLSVLTVLVSIKNSKRSHQD